MPTAMAVTRAARILRSTAGGSARRSSARASHSSVMATISSKIGPAVADPSASERAT